MREALAIDLGGTELRVAIVDEAGRVHDVRRTSTDTMGGPEAVVAQMAALAAELGIAGRRLAGVGVGSPGPLDAEGGVVTGPPTLAGWTDFPLRDRLAARLGLPVAIDNDGHAAALGEWRYGAARGALNFVYVTVSTGIGGGVVCDGRLIRGRGGLAGHVGHMMITEGAERCSCGATGCLEAVASGSALGRFARIAALADPDGAIAREAGGGLADARHLGVAAHAGDRIALDILGTASRRLGRGLASLIHLYAPETVVIGGGVSALFDLMQPILEATVAAHALPAFLPVAIRPAGLGRDAGLVGAAALVLAPDRPRLPPADLPAPDRRMHAR